MGSRAGLKRRMSNARPKAERAILAAKDISELSPEELEGRAAPVDPALDVECPTCGAEIGEPCMTPGGKVAKKSHAKRGA